MKYVLISFAISLPLFLGVSGVATASPVVNTCEEGSPCWRAWMGNGQVGAKPPLYMYLPEGAAWDAIAPLFGYIAE